MREDAFDPVIAFLLTVILFLLLSGCSYTNCTFTSAKLSAGGDMTADVRQVPLDKSTTGAVTSSHTVSPTATLTGIPGM